MHKAKADNLLRKTMRLSTLEGVFAQIYGTFAMIGSSFIVKLLILLQAAPIHFSLLSSIGQVSQIFQPLGVAVSRNFSTRKKPCVIVTAIGRFLTFFLGLGLIFTNTQTGIWFTLLLLFCSAALLSIGGNIWIAWLSDLVPLSYRGRFFSRRSQYLLFAGLIAGYIGSFAVDLFDLNRKGIHQSFIRLTGLADWFRPEYQEKFIIAVFVFATIIGLVGLAILARQPERKVIVKKESLLSIYKRPLLDANFRKLMLFVMWWMLAVGVGSAFWSPFMLKKLQMSLFEVQLYGSLHMISSLLALRFWGRFIDANGNKTAMKICIILGGLNPMFWLFMTAQNHLIIWFEALLSGFMWAGTGIIMTNFVLSLAPKGQTQVYSGLNGALGGICMMLTTMLSGLFYPSDMQILNQHLESEQVLFGLTGLLRWSTIIPLMFIAEAKSRSLRDLGILFRANVISRIRQIWH